MCGREELPWGFCRMGRPCLWRGSGSRRHAFGYFSLCRWHAKWTQPGGPGAARAAARGKASVLCPLSLAEFLLYRGKADLTVLDENKNTALHLACSKVRPGSVVARAASGAGLDEGGGSARLESGLERPSGLSSLYSSLSSRQSARLPLCSLSASPPPLSLSPRAMRSVPS